MHRRQTVPCGQCDDQLSIDLRNHVRQHDEPDALLVSQRSDGALDLGGIADSHGYRLHSQSGRGDCCLAPERRVSRRFRVQPDNSAFMAAWM